MLTTFQGRPLSQSMNPSTIQLTNSPVALFQRCICCATLISLGFAATSGAYADPLTINSVRVSPREFNDVPGSTLQDVIQEQANITMSWPQLKMLAEYISATVQVMEREVGPITSVGLPIEELQKQSNEIIKGFAIRKK